MDDDQVDEIQDDQEGQEGDEKYVSNTPQLTICAFKHDPVTAVCWRC